MSFCFFWMLFWLFDCLLWLFACPFCCLVAWLSGCLVGGCLLDCGLVCLVV